MPESILVVVGASGAGRRVLDIALDVMDGDGTTPFTSVGVVDDDPSDRNLAILGRQGVLYLGTSREWLSMEHDRAYFSVGIGDPSARKRLAERFRARGHIPATLIAPSAHVSRSASVGAGCVISPGADLSANVRLGSFVHVMANASVSHDCLLGDFINVNPGAVLAGDCSVGSNTTIGAGSVVLQQRSVGDGVVVGAGAVVTRDVPSRRIAAGVPARWDHERL